MDAEPSKEKEPEKTSAKDVIAKKRKRMVYVIIVRAIVIFFVLLVIYYFYIVANLSKSASATYYEHPFGWAALQLVFTFYKWIIVLPLISLFIAWIFTEIKISLEEKKVLKEEEKALPEADRPTKEPSKNDTNIYAKMMGINALVGVGAVVLLDVIRALWLELSCGLIRGNYCREGIWAFCDGPGVVIAAGVALGVGQMLAFRYHEKKTGEKNKYVPPILRVSLVISTVIIVAINYQIMALVFHAYEH